MIRKRWKNRVLAGVLAATVTVSLCGCNSFFLNKSPEIKHYEATSEPSALEPEKEIVRVDWEEALELAADYLQNMTLEEKVGQIFMVNLEQLDKSQGKYYEFRKYTKNMRQTVEKYHIGGVLLFSRNIAKRKQTLKLTEKLLHADRTPLFIAVDEEGGGVARVASNPKMKTTAFPPAEEIGETQDDEYTYEMGKTIGNDIRNLGFNVDFAPVADVKTEELNGEIGNRSFGSDPQKVSEHVSAFIQGLDASGISGTLKHFPGQGSSGGDTHKGSVDIDSSIASLRKNDFVPFQVGIEAGADFVMTSHISVSKVTETSTPASMSDLMMETILREELGFQRIIITDSFAMRSITDYYSPAEAAYNAFQAGADIILMPENLEEAYQEIYDKVSDGTIEEARLDASVLRILAVKIERGVLTKEQVMTTPEPSEEPTPEPTVKPAKKSKGKKSGKKTANKKLIKNANKKKK